MCGLFGWNLDKVRDESRFGMVVLALAASNQSRGDHGWGFAGYRPDGNLVYDRGTDGFVQNAPMPDLLKMPQVICHTRYATVGPRTKLGSHPFQHGTIIGAHNGVIHNWSAIENKYTERKAFKVDSEHIFAHLDEEKDLDELDGYGAVEYMDTEDAWKGREVQGFCFNHRDFYVAMVKELKGCVWSSSETHLTRALKLVDLPFTMYAPMEHGKRYSIMADGLKVHDKKIMQGNKATVIQKADERGHYRGGQSLPFGMAGGVQPSAPTGSTTPAGKEVGTTVGSTGSIRVTNGPIVVKMCEKCGIYWHENDTQICWGCNQTLTTCSVDWLRNTSPKLVHTLYFMPKDIVKDLIYLPGKALDDTSGDHSSWISASHINRLAHRKQRKRIIEAIRESVKLQEEGAVKHG